MIRKKDYNKVVLMLQVSDSKSFVPQANNYLNEGDTFLIRPLVIERNLTGHSKAILLCY